eukprot:GHVT01059167.1.p3 GENE.GHVT01059167.1~~GHVT01059167.1.p3  ORF type:complete len:103 (-),score=18.39 GHVT01059167.1:1700-2008(-)
MTSFGVSPDLFLKYQGKRIWLVSSSSFFIPYLLSPLLLVSFFLFSFFFLLASPFFLVPSPPPFSFREVIIPLWKAADNIRGGLTGNRCSKGPRTARKNRSGG